MKTIEVRETQYILTKDEIEIIYLALDYVAHRQDKHKKAPHISFDGIRELLTEIDEDKGLTHDMDMMDHGDIRCGECDKDLTKSCLLHGSRSEL